MPGKHDAQRILRARNAQKSVPKLGERGPLGEAEIQITHALTVKVARLLQTTISARRTYRVEDGVLP
jgi:hypothetical protein